MMPSSPSPIEVSNISEHVPPDTAGPCRRSLLAMLAAGAICGTQLGMASGGAPTPAGVIDLHSHHYPQFIIDATIEAGVARRPVTLRWSAEEQVEDMDRAGIARSMLSTAQSAWTHNIDAARVIPRRSNEFAMRLATDHKGRFGVFAAIPLPFVEEALREIAYALDVLGCDGVGLFTSYGDKWLGDPAFSPVLEELDRRGAVVHVHPMAPNCCGDLIPEFPSPAIELGTDTTRMMGQFIFNGASQRYPNLKMILSHGGGTFANLIERFRFMAAWPQYRDRLPQGFDIEARRFYFDTAQASNKTAMAALRSIVAPSHILFGSDFPARQSTEQIAALRANGVFSASELAAIEYGNAYQLIPDLAMRPGTRR